MTVLSPALKRLILQAMYAPFLVRDMIFCAAHGLRWHASWRLWGLPFVQLARKSVVTIGANFTACSTSSHNSIGVFQRVTLKTNARNARLIIGHHVGISGCSIAAAERIEIGNYVLIGSGCLITDSDAHSLDPLERRRNGSFKTAPVIIEDDVFIGARSVVLKGTRVGRGSVIGAGSVVSKDIPPYVIAAGNPCKVLRVLPGRVAPPPSPQSC
jgi:acetyltransferase-like isoleucine patch superfamily enzyme